MKFVIEFFRIRAADDARAMIGRETADAADLEDAIDVARQLCETLVMPQRPDGMTIVTSEGATLYSGVFPAAKTAH